jgi:hypothetical protein
MDKMMGFKGERIPDGPTTPGRSKVVWKPTSHIKITFEQHPYDVGSPAYHSGPHYHIDMPGTTHARFIPGQPLPR